MSSTYRDGMVTVQHCEYTGCDTYLGANYPTIWCDEHRPPKDSLPQPLHRWKSNEVMENVPYTFDFCIACRVAREEPMGEQACPQVSQGHYPSHVAAYKKASEA